jgi:hypothetical protein
VQVDHRYDVGAQQLFTSMLDPDYLRARSARFGGIGEPLVTHVGGDVQVSSIRQLPLDRVPAAFRRFVGDGRVLQLDSWSGPNADRVEGVWSIDSGRAPVELHGAHLITAEQTGSRYLVTADVRVTLPLAGPLRRQVEAYLSQLVAAEQKFLAEWVAA